MRIFVNRARCKKCGDTIESKHRWDFRTCSCGAVSVDGGHDYLRRVGDIDAMEELSIYDDDRHSKTDDSGGTAPAAGVPHATEGRPAPSSPLAAPRTNRRNVRS